jgi:type I restriction enzyme S subunit
MEVAEKKKLKVPKLRFREFEDGWSNKRLKDITKINQGLQIAISERYTHPIEGGRFYITNEFLRVGAKSQYYILNPPDSVCCKEEDILMTRTGNTGQVVTGVNGAFHNNFFKIKHSDNVDRWFLYFFLTSYNTQGALLKLAGTSTIPDLNHGDFYRVPINLPTFPEQQKIAGFLSAVDEKLKHLDRKKQLLEQYKKGVMHQLFSQQLRFKREDGSDYEDWEEKRLGEVGDTYNGLTGKTAEDFGEGLPYVNYKQIFDNSRIDPAKFDFVKITEGENQSKANYGDVFFTTSSETRLEVGFASVLLDEVEELYLNSFCFGYRIRSFEVFNPEFARYLFRSEMFRKEIVKLGQGSTRYNMSKNEMKKMFVSLPCQEEQQKIADFLSSLDEKIDAVGAQIALTQQFKKGLLQEMFV